MKTFNKPDVQIRQLSIEEIREIYSGFNFDQKVKDPDWENFFPWGIEERIETETGVKILFAYPKDMLNHMVRGRSQSIYKKEPWTTKWLQNVIEKDSVFYDIGANCGQYSLYATQLGCDSVYAFEPHVRNFGFLVDNIVMNHCSDVIFPMNVPVSDEVSYKIWNQGMRGGEGISSERPSNSKSVKTRLVQETLDNLVYTHGLQSPTILKIDVDGTNDTSVLEGGWKCISASVKHIMIEVFEGNPRFEVAKEKLLDSNLLTGMGFKINHEMTDSVYEYRKNSNRAGQTEIFFER